MAVLTSLIVFTAVILQSAASDLILGDAGNIAAECGGTIRGLSGAINYRLNQNITLGEQNKECVWTILAPNKSEIQIQLIHDGFPAQSSAQLDVFIISSRPKLEHRLKIKGGDRKVYTLSGSSQLQILFSTWTVADGLKGFSLIYNGVGPDVNDGKGMKIFDSQLEQPGLIRYPEPGTPQTREFVTLVVNPSPDYKKLTVLTINWLQGGPYLSACYFPEDTLYVHELGSLVEGSLRLSECGHRRQATKTTLYSRLPLVVTYYKYNWATFEVSWEFVDS